MNLFVRNRPYWCNFVHTVDELKSLEEFLIPGKPILIGDLSLFNKPMINRLLKLLEENSFIDCYSSEDILDPILLSRFVKIVKDPIKLIQQSSTQGFLDSDRSAQQVEIYMSSLDFNLKLRLINAPNFAVQMMLNI